MLERLFKWLIPNESSALRARRIRGAQVVIAIAAFAALILFLSYVHSHPLIWSMSGGDWFVLVCGVYLAYSLTVDLRSGSINISPYGTGDDKTAYLRSADPVGYWILIALKVAVAVGLVVGSLGDLLELWNWH